MLLLLILILLLGAAPAGNADTLKRLTDLESCVSSLAQPAGAARRALPTVLRVGSWNMMKEEVVGAGVLSERLTVDSELFLSQEALASPGSADSSPGERYFAPGYRRGDVLTGVALHSLVSADVLCTLQFQEPWLRTPKAVLAARLPMGETSLLAVNLHGINFTLGSGAYRRQLTAVAELVAVHEGPVLVAGDLNHWNPWRRRVLAEFARDAGLAEAEFSPDWRSRHLGSAVDGAFVRGLEVLSAVALPTSLSDHHPLLLILSQPP